MITEHDLEEAIAECQGRRDPDAQTCIMLAAFYTIRNEMFPKEKELPAMPVYSMALPPTETAETVIKYDSGSEFARVIHGRSASAVWAVMDDLMNVLAAINPRLYNATLNKIEQ